MACKIYFRRFVALLLCCLLAFYTPLLPIAHALDPATIAIAGGQLAGGGLEGAAAASTLAGPVGAVVGLTLAACGLSAYVSSAAQAAGKTRTSFVLDKLALWSFQAGYAKEQIYSKIANGLSVAADGTIQLSNDVAKIIGQFGEWLFTQENTVVPEIGTGETVTTATIGDYSLTTFNASSTLQYIPATGFTASNSAFNSLGIKSTRDVGIIGTTNGFIVVCLSSVSGTSWNYSVSYDDTAMGNGGGTLRSKYNGTYLGYYSTLIFNFGISMFPGTNADYLDYVDQHSLSVSQVTNPAADEVFTGTPEAWAEHKDVLNPSADEDTPAAVLNPDVLNPIIEQLAEGTQWQMGIDDYLAALQAAFDQAITGITDQVADLTDVVTGIRKEIAIPDDATKTADLTKPDVKPIDTPVIQPTEVNPDKAIDGISFELDKVFPFCLPFDVYKMLSLLSADPVAPRYHVHYEGPYSIVIDFTVDLSAWDNVALICRNMELLLFCVGLAVVTRSIFIRA